jgi:hypothetical protein
MVTHVIDAHDIHANRKPGRIEVHVCNDGGWDVTAVVEDKIVAIRHCDDWHRVERTRSRFASELGIRSE